MQGDGELDHTEVGAHVAAIASGDADEFLAYFGGELRQLGSGEAFDVVRRADEIEQAWATEGEQGNSGRGSRSGHGKKGKEREGGSETRGW